MKQLLVVVMCFVCFLGCANSAADHLQQVLDNQLRVAQLVAFADLGDSLSGDDTALNAHIRAAQIIDGSGEQSSEVLDSGHEQALFEAHDTDSNSNLDLEEFSAMRETLESLSDGHWGYEENNGPLLWPFVNEYCDNDVHHKQSPISITAENLVQQHNGNCHDNNGQHLNWNINSNLFENQGYHWKIDFNDHHSWKITPVDSNGNDANDAAHCVMELTNVHGAGTYCLAQAHVHYGRDEDEGSEHVIHGEHFPIEMHFVHFRSDYPDLAAALDDWENLQTQDQDHYVLSVVGVMYEISDDSTFENEALHKILQADGSHYLFDSFDIHDLIPNGPTNEFYSYQGSLTTPPCYPNVNWVVLKDKEKISSTEMAHIHEFTHHTSIARHPHLNTNPVYECNAIDIDGL